MSHDAFRSAGRTESKPRSRALRRVGPGTWQGPNFYVWDEEKAEAERWARALADVLPADEEARR